MKDKITSPVKVLKKNVSPIKLGNQFLYHEFLKIFRDIEDKLFHKKIKKSLDAFIRREGRHHYWLLISAIAEGWRVKHVYRLLTNTGYHWNLELRQISDLTMTGLNPPIVDRLIHRCQRDFHKFAAYYHRHPVFFKKYMPNLLPRPERDHHPVFVYWDARHKQLRLFDGMRRTVLQAVKNKKTIKAFVGYPVKSGKQMVNLDKISFFQHTFLEAKKSQPTYRSFITVGREIAKQSKNGTQAFRSIIKPWSDKKLVALINAITKKK